MTYTIVKTLEKTDFGNKFSVSKLLVKASNGKQTEMYMRAGEDFAVVIPMLSQNELVMISQPRLMVSENTLEFPTGQVAGKDGVEIAITELKEETGYTADKMVFLGAFYPAIGWSTQRALVYVAEGLKPGEPEPEEFEFITTHTVSIAEIEKQILDNNILSLPTMAAFFLFKEKYLRE